MQHSVAAEPIDPLSRIKRSAVAALINSPPALLASVSKTSLSRDKASTMASITEHEGRGAPGKDDQQSTGASGGGYGEAAARRLSIIPPLMATTGRLIK